MGSVKDSGSSELARYYDAYWSAEGYHPQGQLGNLAAIFARHLPAAGRCIDIGCGDARFAGPLMMQRGFAYQGVDVSINAVQEARALGLNADVIESATNLPFPNATFDAAICIEVLEHLFLPVAALEEILRVLKPGGVLIVTTPNVAYWRRRVDLALLGRWNPFGDGLAVEQPWRDPHIRFFNRGSLKRCLATAGFVNLVIGAHLGGFLTGLPWIGSRVKGSSRSLTRLWPALFGIRLYGVGHKPTGNPEAGGRPSS